MGELGGSLGRSPDLLDVVAHRLPPVPLGCFSRARHLLGDEGGVVQDHAEQVVEVVRHAAGQLTQALQPLPLVELGFETLALGQRAKTSPLGEGVDPLGHVANGGRHDQAVLGLEGGQGDLRRELRAVLATTDQLHAGAHRPRERIADVPRPVARVHRLDAVGDEHLDQAPDQLLTRIPEELLGLPVDEHDLSARVDAEDGVGRGLEQAAELRLGSLAIRDVADGSRDEESVNGLDPGQRDLRRELGPVPASSDELDPGTHRTGRRVAEVRLTMLGMVRSGGVRHQDLDRLTEHLRARVAEDDFGLSGEDRRQQLSEVVG